LVGFTASVFSLGYIGQVVPPEKTGKIRRYYARFNLFLLSMLAVPVLAHVALVWIAVELTTLLSVFLVSFEDTPEALEAAWKYVVLTCMGAAFALVGVLFLYWGMKIAGQSDFTWSGLVAASTNIPPRLLKAAFLFFLTPTARPRRPCARCFRAWRRQPSCTLSSDCFPCCKSRRGT